MTAPASSVDPLTAAHNALAPLLPILDAFNHRNKNQHRATHWFASFSILRRAARSLSHDLGDATTTKRALKRRDVALSSSPAVVRARWMLSHLLPRCYISFTQLAADNQHAALGLLLVAVLARINTILITLLPPDPAAELPPAEETQQSPTSHRQSAVEPSAPGADRGVVVARQGTPPDMLVHAAGEALERPVGSPPASPGPLVKVRSEKKTRSRDKDKDKERKKKRKKGGDELSSLFGSLT